MRLTISQNSLLRKNDLIREGLREVLTRLSRHHQSSLKKNIILISSGRTGSTLLMESLGAEPGLRFVNEPFSRKHLSRSSLARHQQFQNILIDKTFLTLNEEERKDIHQYMTDFRQLRRAGPYNPLKPNFHRTSDRLIFKILKMNLVLDFFLKQADRYEFLWLVRHPAPTILSSLPMKIRYDSIDLPSYLSNQAFCEQYLNPEQVGLIRQIHESGREHQVWAAEWAIDHMVPYHHYTGSNSAGMLLVSYEQLILQPELVIGRIADRMGLERQDLILQELKIPSASTRNTALKEIQQFDAAKKIKAWRSKVSPDFESEVFDIIQSLGIDLYGPGKDTLQEEFLIRESGAKP